MKKRAGRCLQILILMAGALAAASPDGDGDTDGDIESASTDKIEVTEEAVFADEMVVTAAYRAEVDTPVTHSEIDGQAIVRKNFGQEPSSLLAQTPSMTSSIDSGGFAGYSYFRLRGIDQTRINMTLDGVPLNEPEDQGG